MKDFVEHLEHDAVAIPQSDLPPPVLTYISSERAWRLEADYSYPDGPTTITVPAGFMFDLASVPRWFWWLIAPFELSVSAPLIHDFLYKHAGDPPAGSVEPPRTYTRKQADQLFRRMMEEEGVPAWRRRLAYWAVRAFGGFGWK